MTVILKHVFHPTELEEEPQLKVDLEADMASECTKLGPVDKVPNSLAPSLEHTPGKKVAPSNASK